MKLPGMLPFRFIAIWLAVLSRAAHGSGDGLSQQYCSGENTASDFNAVYNIYNSNGACYQQCMRNYAFAVVQGQNCWCSNYIPANQQSTEGCNQKCPGYPDDLCGNANAGLFGYISLPNVQPSGTAGASSSEAPSSTAAPSSTETSAQPSSTQQSSNVQTSSEQPATSYTPSSSSTPSTSTSSTPLSSPSTSSNTDTPYVAPVPVTSNSPTASATPSPVTSVRVVTLSGAVVTQTVTSTPMVAPGSDSQTEPIQQKRMSGGAIAGIVIGSMIGTAALLIGGFLLWRRSRKNDEPEAAGAGTNTRRGPNSPRRNISVLSKTGLLSRGRPMSFNEKDFDDQMYVNTGNNSVRHSMLFGAGANGEGVSPVSPLGSSHDNDSSRRFSRPLVYDQRLNPSALFANAEANGSRISMQDQQDYSRPLGIANPDPRPSFDSRISRG